VQGSMILPIFILFVLTVNSGSAYWHSWFTQGRDSKYNTIKLPQWMLCFKNLQWMMEVHTTHSLCQQGSQCHQDYLEVCVLYRVKLTHSF